MSYCRHGDDSDIYMIRTADNFCCMGAGWRLEASNPVHETVMVDEWIHEGADGVQFKYPDLPESPTEEALNEWKKAIPSHEEPVKVVRTGNQVPSYGCFDTKSRQEMINHLEDHLAAGHKVPERAFSRLYKEMATQGDRY